MRAATSAAASGPHWSLAMATGAAAAGTAAVVGDASGLGAIGRLGRFFARRLLLPWPAAGAGRLPARDGEGGGGGASSSKAAMASRASCSSKSSSSPSSWRTWKSGSGGSSWNPVGSQPTIVPLNVSPGNDGSKRRTLRPTKSWSVCHSSSAGVAPAAVEAEEEGPAPTPCSWRRYSYTSLNERSFLRPGASKYVSSCPCVPPLRRRSTRTTQPSSTAASYPFAATSSFSCSHFCCRFASRSGDCASETNCTSSSSSPPPPAPSRSTTADAGDAAAGEPSSTSSTSSTSSSAGGGATAGDGVAASCICRRFFAACCFADASHSRRSSGCSCSSFRGALRSRSGRLRPRPRAACAAARRASARRRRA